MDTIISTLDSMLFSALSPILEKAAGTFIGNRFHELNGIRKEQKKSAQQAINRAFEEWIIAIFNNLQAQEFEESDLRQFFEDYKKDIEIFLNDPEVAEELLKPFFATTEYRIDSHLLVRLWKALKLRELPEEFDAASVSRAYLKRVKKAGIVTSEIRELFLTQLAQEQTVKTALQWLERSAKQGVTQAQNLISEIKREREREYEQLSLDELLIRAKTDGEQVYYFIGLKYYQGKEVRKDIDIALKYFYQAAKQGVIDAQNRIGELEAEQNKQRPLTELFMKANKGEAQAQYLLGLRYYEDEDKDIYTALEWFEKAAEQDVVEAQEMISVIEKYYEQLPLQTLFTQAEIGDKQAQYLLGLKYYQGTEVQQNMKLALEWLYKATEQGVIKAQDLIILIKKQE